MANSTEGFLAKFQELQGTIGAGRKRDVFKLLKESRLSKNDELEVAKLIQPRNYSERVLYADVVIYFKHVEPLLGMLMTGNEIYVSKILKQRELLKQIFENITSDQVVDEILCNLSYCVKMKVLRKLLQCKSAEQIDEIFEKISDRYGLHYARILLRGCTVQKIKTFLENFTVVCDSNELIALHKKDPSLVTLYFIELKKRNSLNCDNHFLAYLADNDPSMLWELLIKYKLKTRFTLGRRTTKKLLPAQKDKVLNESNTYLKYFKQERVIRILNKQGEFPILYKNLFPEEPAEIESTHILMDMLKYCPKRLRYDLFVKCFQEVFQEDIWTNEEHISDKFLDYIYDKNIREQWGKVKYERTDNHVYLKYYSPPVGIPMLKERINITMNQRKRAEIIDVLTQVSIVNHDINLLEEVVNYICERHRNDSQWARSIFINRIFENFKTEEFTEKVWVGIDNILTIMSINRETYLVEACDKHIVKYILHLYSINNDKTAQEVILKYIPKTVEIDYLISVDMKNPEQERKFLTFILNSCDKILSKEEDAERNDASKVMIIHMIQRYNSKYPKRKILLEESDKEFYRDVLTSGNNSLNTDVFRKDLMKTDKDKFEEEEFDLFCRYTLSVGMYKFKDFVIWNFRKNSEKFLQYLNILVKGYIIHDPCDYVLDYVLKYYAGFRRYFLYFGLEQPIKEQVLQHLAVTRDVHEKINCIVMLSYILHTEEFISIMDKNGIIPTISKPDNDDAASVELFKLQKCFVGSLKNLREGPSSYLPFLLKKCTKGDFLQPSLRILSKAFYYLPENKLQTYVDILQKRTSVSLQKQAFFLAVHRCNKSVAIKTLKSLEMVENESIKKAVSICSIKYFSKCPSQETFNLVLDNMKLLTENDEEAFNLLISIKPIDPSYKIYYSELVWNRLVGMSNNAKSKVIQNTFLTSMNEAVIEKLPLETCKAIIESRLLNIDMYKGFLEGINNFVANFLNTHLNEESFEFVFKLVLNYKQKYWSHCKPSERSEVLKLFNTFYNKALQDDFDIIVFKKFLLYWSHVFSPIDSFSVFIKGNVLLMWKESSDLQNFASKMVSYLNEINTNYGGEVLKVAKIILSLKLNLENFLIKVLKKSSEPLVLVWVIKVLKAKGDLIVGDKIRKKYLGIVELLKKGAEENDNVKMHYNDLFEKY